MLVVTLLSIVAPRAISSTSCRRASSRARTPACSSPSPRRPQDISFDAMASASEARRRDHQGRSQRQRRHCDDRRDRLQPGAQQRPPFRRAQAARASAGRRRRSGDPAAAPRSVGRMPGINVFFQSRCRTSSSAAGCRKSHYQYTLQDGDRDELYQLAPQLAGAASRSCRGFQDVNSDLQIRNRRPCVDVDRDKARAARHHRSTRSGTRSTAPSARGRSRRSTRRRTTTRSSSKSTRASSAIRPMLSQTLSARRATARSVPLVGDRDGAHGIGPLTVNHQGQLPAVTISFNLAPGVSLGEAVDAHRQRRASVESAGHRHRPASRARRRSSRIRSRARACCSIAAVLVIYMVLGILYESFIHPITILSGLPAGGAGRAAHAARCSTWI